MRSLMALSHSRDDPSSRFRVLQFVPSFEAAGWHVDHRPNVPRRGWRATHPIRLVRSVERKAGIALRRHHRRRDISDARHVDLVFANRDLLEGNVVWEQRLIAANPRLVFDFDDAIYLGQERRDHIGWVCAHAARVTAGNETLASFARQHTDRVTVVPTVVATERYEMHAIHDGTAARVPPGRLRVGWLGSNLSIRETLFPYWEMFGRLQARIGFDFVICSRPRPVPPSDALRWSFVEWSPESEETIARHVDIGVMPLVDTEFQRGKCGLKLLQYMAAGLPVVASPVGVNREIVGDGVNGYLADSEAEWGEALAALVASPDLRRRMGAEGRRICEARYSLSGWAPVLLDIFNRVLSTPVPVR